MKREWRQYIDDIKECIHCIEIYSKNLTEGKFAKDQKTQDAIVRRLEIIGEAVKRVPSSIKNKYDEVDWKKAAGMRNVLIHEYYGVDIRRVWKTVKQSIPRFKKELERILSEMDNNK